MQRIGQRLAFAPSGLAAVIHVDDGRGKRLIVSAPAEVRRRRHAVGARACG